MTKVIGTSELPQSNHDGMPTITAREMMVRNLITLRPEMDAMEALDVLLRHRISGAPVVDEAGRLIGIFSEKSCMEFVVSVTYDGMPTTTVGALVDAAPPTIDEETDLLTIAQMFLTHSCRRLPVIDSSGVLRGQISRRDIMRAVRSHMNTRPMNSDPSFRQRGLFLSAVVSPTERRV